MSDELNNCRLNNKELGKEIQKKENSIKDLNEQVKFFTRFIINLQSYMNNFY